MCVSLILSLVLATAGCGKSPEKDGSGNGKAAEETAAGKGQAAEETAAGDGQAGGEADYDLTSMTSEMVYATVYQMVNEPDDYVGKTVKMKGTYSASYYDPTGQYYHYCVIQDATACCAQGLEFVWGDGSHVYPEEFPEEETEIVVEGVFETYTEDGDSYVYTRLKDASMEIIQ